MVFSKASRTKRRLSAIRQQVAALKKDIGVLDEQVVFLQMAEGDARTDAVVAGHQIAAREHYAAQSDLARAVRQRSEAQDKLAGLLAEQDSLLEQMLH